MAARFRDTGMPDLFVDALAAMNAVIADGAEDQATNAVRTFLGEAPVSFAAFARNIASV